MFLARENAFSKRPSPQNQKTSVTPQQNGFKTRADFQTRANVWEKANLQKIHRRYVLPSLKNNGLSSVQIPALKENLVLIPILYVVKTLIFIIKIWYEFDGANFSDVASSRPGVDG